MFGSDMAIDPSKGFGGGTAYDSGKLFVSTGFGSVFALNAASGQQLWKADLQVPIVNAPVASGGRVLVSSEDNHFVALAQSDGRTLWDHQGISESAGILTSTSAAVAGDTLRLSFMNSSLTRSRGCCPNIAQLSETCAIRVRLPKAPRVPHHRETAAYPNRG